MVLFRNYHGYMVLSFIMSLDFLIIDVAESGMTDIMTLSLESGLQLQFYNKFVTQLTLAIFYWKKCEKLKTRGILKIWFSAQRHYLDIPIIAMFITVDFLRTRVTLHACCRWKFTFSLQIYIEDRLNFLLQFTF